MSITIAPIRRQSEHRLVPTLATYQTSDSYIAPIDDPVWIRRTASARSGATERRMIFPPDRSNSSGVDATVFVTTMTEKMLTYALGRGLTPTDMPAVRRIVGQAGQRQYRFSSIVLGIVNSVPFQMRVKPAGEAGIQAADVRSSEGEVR